MLGACLVWLATLAVLWSLRERPAPGPPCPAPVAAENRFPATAPEPAEESDPGILPVATRIIRTKG